MFQLFQIGLNDFLDSFSRNAALCLIEDNIHKFKIKIFFQFVADRDYKPHFLILLLPKYDLKDTHIYLF
jgi:hypothetical protein